jgi:trimethylamine--corrinoid protein Co-methyltransferase
VADTMMNLWSEEALAAIHDASLAVLAQAGVRVESPQARDLLLAAGCTTGAQDRILMPGGAVEQAIAALKQRYTLAARAADKSLPVGPEAGPTYVHNLGGAREVVDPRTGIGHRATMRDQVALTRVMHHLVNQQSVTSLVQPADVPDALEPLYSYLALAAETDKAIGGPGISYPFQGLYLVEMAKVVTGADGGADRYPVDLAFSPVSPLIFGADVTDALIVALRRGGVVVEMLPCPAAATTAPAALSAAVAQQNAEVLAGVVLVAAVAPGTPVYYGPRLSAVDPRTGVVVSGAPETGVSAQAATLLARRYGMACDCYGPSTDSKVVDAQFGYERALNAITGMAARPRFLSGIGELQAGVATSLEGCVIDDEILNYAAYALTERPWDDAALDVAAIVDGILGGRGFLGTKHTRRFLRSEFVTPLVSYRGGLQEWAASGRVSVVDIARERVGEYLADAPVGLPEDVLAALCELIAAAAAEIGLSSWPEPREKLSLALPPA